MYYDDEIKILNECFDVDLNQVLILSGKENSKTYNNAIKTYNSFCKSTSWSDNSKNTNLPPDIINDELNVFFEVMRFDDHSNNGKDNPTRAKASKIEEELYNKVAWVKKKDIFINAITDLPTEKDHSYKMYLSGFKRTVMKHLSKLSKYSNNFPNFKKGFLVFDESSGIYYELVHKLRKDVLKTMENAVGRPHIFFLDKAFLDVFLESDLDYLIWYAPYKYDLNNLGLVMPLVVFYDIKNLKLNKIIEYNEERMISCEA